MTLDPLSICKGDKFTVEYTAAENARPGIYTKGLVIVPTGQDNNVSFGGNSAPKTITSITRAPRPIRPGDRIRRIVPLRNNAEYRCVAISGEFIFYTIQCGLGGIEPCGGRLDQFERIDD